MQVLHVIQWNDLKFIISSIATSDQGLTRSIQMTYRSSSSQCHFFVKISTGKWSTGLWFYLEDQQFVWCQQITETSLDCNHQDATRTRRADLFTTNLLKSQSHVAVRAVRWSESSSLSIRLEMWVMQWNRHFPRPVIGMNKRLYSTILQFSTWQELQFLNIILVQLN